MADAEMQDASKNEKQIITAIPKMDIVRYKMMDKPPYNVIIESDGNINLIRIGAMMKKMKFDIENVVALNKTKAKIIAKSIWSANKIIDSTELQSSFKVYIPKDYVTVDGLLRNVLPEQDLDDLKNNITDIGNNMGFFVEEVKRLTKYNHAEKKSYPTNNVIITFRGHKTPEKIAVYSTINVIHQFKKKPLQCSNCWNYGHSKSRCKAEAICIKCAQKAHGENDCKISCLHCNGEHTANNISCTKRIEQQHITDIMNSKKISFQAAKEIYQKENNQGAFPTLGSNNKIHFSEVLKLQNRVDELMEELKKRDNQIEDLKTSILNLTKVIENKTKNTPNKQNNNTNDSFDGVFYSPDGKSSESESDSTSTSNTTKNSKKRKGKKSTNKTTTKKSTKSFNQKTKQSSQIEKINIITDGQGMKRYDYLPTNSASTYNNPPTSTVQLY